MDVLMVEDETLLREALTESLEAAGLQVAGAASGEAALEVMLAQAGQPPPPVLVTDVNLGRGAWTASRWRRSCATDGPRWVLSS